MIGTNSNHCPILLMYITILSWSITTAHKREPVESRKSSKRWARKPGQITAERDAECVKKIEHNCDANPDVRAAEAVHGQRAEICQVYVENGPI